MREHDTAQPVLNKDIKRAQSMQGVAFGPNLDLFSKFENAGGAFSMNP